MGYTHYTDRPVGNHGTAEMFGKLALDAKLICEHAQSMGIRLAGPFGEVGTSPEFTEGYFAFNGEDGPNGDLSHETFRWEANPVQPEWRKDEILHFDFCKTNQKPYDAVVTAILIRAKVIYGKLLQVGSDGEWTGDPLSWGTWASGRALYEEVFNIEAPCPFVRAEV
jgi:hypothetical protein